MNFDHVSNKILSDTIDEWVKGERDRKIMKRRLIDKVKYERLSEEFSLSTNNIRRIVYKNEKLILLHINKTEG